MWQIDFAIYPMAIDSEGLGEPCALRRIEYELRGGKKVTSKAAYCNSVLRIFAAPHTRRTATAQGSL